MLHAKFKYLGLYTDEVEAARKSNEAAIELFEDYANLNIIVELSMTRNMFQNMHQKMRQLYTVKLNGIKIM